MKPLLFISLLVVAVFCQDLTDVTKQLSGGLIQGKKVPSTDGSTVGHAYLAIPYAEPPINLNRYKAPVPKQPWTSVLDATEYRVSCLYNSSAVDETTANKFMSEDCLHLNVITSQKCIDEKGCPVVAYLHDGNYNYGSPLTLPVESLVDTWATNNIIIVTINYRLGSFGFLNTRTATTADKNAGLADQIEALNWIQKEIGVFGGDAGKVTLYGHGSAANNVDLLSLSPKANGLFSQIILVNGAAAMTPYLTADSNFIGTMQIAMKTKCYSFLSALFVMGQTAESVVECLRTKTPEELLTIQRAQEDKKSTASGFFGPSLDPTGDGILPQPVYDLMKTRKAFPVLLGRAPEAPKPAPILAVGASSKKKEKKTTAKSNCKLAAQFRGLNATSAFTKNCSKLYENSTSGVDVMDDVMVYIPLYESAYSNAVAGGKSYLFEIDAPTSPLMSQSNSKAFMNYVLRFIKNGDPSTTNNTWQPFEAARANYLKISADFASIVNTDGYHTPAINFWEKDAVAISSMPKTKAATIKIGQNGGVKGSKPAKPTAKPPASPDEGKQIAKTIMDLVAEAKNRSSAAGSIWEFQLGELMSGLQGKINDLNGLIDTSDSVIVNWTKAHPCKDGAFFCFKSAKVTLEAEDGEESSESEPKKGSSSGKKGKGSKPVWGGFGFGSGKGSGKGGKSKGSKATKGPIDWAGIDWASAYGGGAKGGKGKGKGEKPVKESTESEEADLYVTVKVIQPAEVPAEKIKAEQEQEQMYSKLDEIATLLDQILKKIDVEDDKESTTVVASVESAEPLLRKQLLQAFLPVIIPTDGSNETVVESGPIESADPTASSNDGPEIIDDTYTGSAAAQATVASAIVFRNDGWNTWFWVMSGIAAVLAFLLIVVCCMFVQARQKRVEYERIA